MVAGERPGQSTGCGRGGRNAGSGPALREKLSPESCSESVWTQRRRGGRESIGRAASVTGARASRRRDDPPVGPARERQGRPSAVTRHRTRDDKDQRRRAARSSKARRQTVFLGPDAKTFRCDVCPSTLCDARATPTPQPRPRHLRSNRWHLPASCGRFVGTEEEEAMLHVGVPAGRTEGSASSV